MGHSLGKLDDDGLAKANRHMRALRRAILSYWYATIEDQQAALIEATNACLAVNILDESVFQVALGAPYEEHRANTRGGRVVMGLELVRNCETHSPIAFEELLVEKRIFGVPLASGGQVMRPVWHWASYDALPSDYVELQGGASASQKRARRAAQHGYRQGVQQRSVIEALFDAEQFFVDVEPRLSATSGPQLDHSFAEVPQGKGTVLHRPLEAFAGNAPLPGLANRWHERTTAGAPPADQYVKELASNKNKDVPAGDKRIVTHKISESGRIIGFSGHLEIGPVLWSWVERSAQIGRDIRSGFSYVVVRPGADDVPVVSSENLSLTASVESTDLLMELPEAEEALGLGRLRLLEDYPDAYLEMRRGL